MHSVAPEGRSVVLVSSTGAVSIDAAANAFRQADTTQGSRAAAARNVLNQIIQAFDGLFSSSVQSRPISQGPVLFSANTPSSADSLSSIRSTLDGISQKLSALVNGKPAVGTALPAPTGPTSASPQPSADWPFPDLGPNPPHGLPHRQRTDRFLRL